MAKKHPGNEPASGVVFDQRTKAVMATNHAENVKAKIARVRECVPNNVRKDDIAIILEHYDNDTTKAIDAFTCGNADSILQTWTVSGKKGAKGTQSSRRKRRNRGGNQSNTENEESRTENIQNPSKTQPIGNSNSLDSSSKDSTTSSAKPSSARIPQPGNNNNNRANQPNLNHPPGPQSRQQGGGGSSIQSSRPVVDRRPDGRGQQRGPGPRNRHDRRGSGDRGNQRRRGDGGPSNEGGSGKSGPHRTTTSEVELEASNDPAAQNKRKTGAHLERLEKDLHRTIVSLTRCKSLLTTQLEDSEKRLKRSMQEAQRQLQEREIVLKDEFNDVKRQTETLIDNRQKLATDLRMKIATANSLTETELLELRATVKQFVSDRKTDEEIAQTMRYTYTPDQLVAEIKAYGDVNTDVGRYSSRRPSLSSLSTLSRTTSVCEDGPLSRGVSMTESLKSPDSTSGPGPKSPGGPSGPKSPEMDISAEAHNFAAKLQQRYQSRGRGGPRGPRGGRSQSGGRGGRQGGRGSGRPLQNSGGQEQGSGRRRQNSATEDGNTRRRQDSGSQDPGRRQQGRDAGRRRQNSGQTSGNNDGGDTGRRRQNSGQAAGNDGGSGDLQRSPRRGDRTRQRSGNKESKDPGSPKGTTAGMKVVPTEDNAPAEETLPAGDSPKKQRNANRRTQHRRRQGARRDSGEPAQAVEGQEAEMEKSAQNGLASVDGPQDSPEASGDTPKPTENGPKQSTPNDPKTTPNGPKTTPNGPETTLNGPKETENDTEGVSNSKALPVALPNGGLPIENGGDFVDKPVENGGIDAPHGDMKKSKKIEEIGKADVRGDKEEAVILINGDAGHSEEDIDGEEK